MALGGRWKVLITSPSFHTGDETDCHLRESGAETVFNSWHPNRTEEELIDLLHGIDGVLVTGREVFTRKVIDASDRLKVISRSGVGYETIDVEAATSRGIAVCTTPGANQRSVAEYAFGLILQCARKMVENLSEVPKGTWGRHVGRDLGGSTLGVVGLGAIGKEVAKRARAFEMRVLAYDLVEDAQFAAQHQVGYVSLEQLLRESDFVTLHLFMDERSRHLISAERLALMKGSAYLVNTSRGGVVDSEALYHCLSDRRIAGAALDVHEREPLPTDSPFRELENVYLSAHVASASVDALREMGRIAAENVTRVLAGSRPHHVVNPDALGPCD